MATVIEIVAEHLRANGYGGLVMPDAQCGCEVADLVPCDSNFCDCKPGYKHVDPRPESNGAWLISTSPEPPTQEEFDALG